MKLMWKMAGAAMVVLFAVLVAWARASPPQAVSLKLIRFETNLSTAAPVPFEQPQPQVVAVLCLTNASRRAVSYVGNPSGQPFCRLSALDGDGLRRENESLVGFGMGGASSRILRPSQSVNFAVLIASPLLADAREMVEVSVPYHVPLAEGGIWKYLPEWADPRVRCSRRVARTSFQSEPAARQERR